MYAQCGYIARVLLLSSAAGLALNSTAYAQEAMKSQTGADPFSNYTPLSADELMQARGGFSAGGFKFNIGVTVAPPVVTPADPFSNGGPAAPNVPASDHSGSNSHSSENSGHSSLADSTPHGGHPTLDDPLPEGGPLGPDSSVPDNGGPFGSKGPLPDDGPLGGSGKSSQTGANTIVATNAPPQSRGPAAAPSGGPPSTLAASPPPSSPQQPPTIAAPPANSSSPTIGGQPSAPAAAPTLPAAPGAAPAPPAAPAAAAPPAPPATSAPQPAPPGPATPQTPAAPPSVAAPQPTAPDPQQNAPALPAQNATPPSTKTTEHNIQPGGAPGTPSSGSSANSSDAQGGSLGTQLVLDTTGGEAPKNQASTAQPSNPGAAPKPMPSTSFSVTTNGKTVLHQNGMALQIDNSRDNVILQSTTNYSVVFENYHQAIDMAVGLSAVQSAIATQSILSALQN